MVIAHSVITSDPTPIDLVLYDKVSETKKYSLVAEPTLQGVYSYTFTDILPGNYEVIAGSDIDLNSYLCEYGEICGVYPVLSKPKEITVELEDVNGVDFGLELVNPNHSFSASNTQDLNARSTRRTYEAKEKPTRSAPKL